MLNYFLITLASSVNAFFGFIKLVNLLGIRFYYFYSHEIVDIVIFSPSLDLWVWSVTLLVMIVEMFLLNTLLDLNFPRWTILPGLLSFVSLAGIIVNNDIGLVFAIPLGFVVLGLSIHYGNGYLYSDKEKSTVSILACVAAFLITIELLSLLSWVWNAFDYEVAFGSSLRWKFPWIDLQFFSLFYPLTPLLLFSFLFSWVWVPVLKRVLSRTSALKNWIVEIEKRVHSNSHNASSDLSSRHLIVGLVLSQLTSFFTTCFSFVHFSTSTLVGADSFDYYAVLKDMMQRGPWMAFGTDRPFSHLSLYFLKSTFGLAPEIVIRIVPVLLSVFLGLVVFWFVKLGSGNARLALTSSFLSSFSFHTTVGVFAYYVANWLAIIEILILLALMLKSFEKGNWSYMLISSIMGAVVLLTHPYTWYVMIAVIFSYFVWIFLRKEAGYKFEGKSLVWFLTANALFFVAYTLSPVGKGVSSSAATLFSAPSSTGVLNLLNLHNSLESMVRTYLGGLFGNPLLFALAICGIFLMLDVSKRFNRILLLWVAIPSLALLFVSPDPFFYRLIYLIPVQIPAALGLCWVVSKIEGKRSIFRRSKSSQILKILIITLVMLFLCNYALRSVDEAIIHII